MSETESSVNLEYKHISSLHQMTVLSVIADIMTPMLLSNKVTLVGHQAGLRQLVSWDLDTEWAEFVQFYLRMGGEGAECNQADSREEGLLLQYSNDGGISWGLIAEMYFTDFTKPR